MTTEEETEIEKTMDERTTERFQRVKVTEELKKFMGDKRLLDNTYESTFGGGGWGAKASATLLRVRGKDFRHEKTKKKRGSYRGGKISMASASIKFNYD